MTNPYLLAMYWVAILLSMSVGLIESNGLPLGVALASAVIIAPKLVQEADDDDEWDRDEDA